MDPKNTFVKKTIDSLDAFEEWVSKNQNQNKIAKEHKGLTVFSINYLKQYKLFLKGYYNHLGSHYACNQAEHIRLQKKALQKFTDSLKLCGESSSNGLRLRTLEHIRIILEKMKRNDSRLSCGNIYMYLAHHYIERRSVVFVIDSTFSSYAML